MTNRGQIKSNLDQFEVGDTFTLPIKHPWWVRLIAYFRGQDPNLYVVTNITSDLIKYETADEMPKL